MGVVGAVGLIVAAAIILALQWNTNDAVEFSGPATAGRQGGAHVGTVPDRSGSVISPEDAQDRALHQRR